MMNVYSANTSKQCFSSCSYALHVRYNHTSVILLEIRHSGVESLFQNLLKEIHNN